MKTEINRICWKKRFGIAVMNGGLFMLVFGIVHYVWNGEIYDWKGMVFQGVFFGVFMAIIFPFLFGKLAANLDKNIHPDLSPDEEIETEGPANLFRGAEAVGGKLYLTNQKLIFKSHSFNIQTGQSAIPYERISEVSARKMVKLVENGLRISTPEGLTYDFVVEDRALWIEKLEEKLKVD